jgi:hypothetical protein
MAGEARVCPHCNGTSLQTVPYAFESGVTTTQGTIIRRGMFGAPRDSRPTETKSTTVSATAARLAPPRKKGLGWPILILVIGLIAIGELPTAVTLDGSVSWPTAIGTFALGIALPAWLIVSRFRFNRFTMPRLMQEWSSSWFCLSCGNIFNPFK